MAKTPKYKVPSSEELAGTPDKIDERATWYDISEWEMSVRLRPVAFGRYLSILRDAQLQQEKNPNFAELQRQLSWISACLVEPKLSFDQIQKLAEADTKPVMNLSVKCQVISGNLPEDFDPEVDEAKNDSEAEESIGESTPPALNDSEPSPAEQDSLTMSSQS